MANILQPEKDEQAQNDQQDQQGGVLNQTGGLTGTSSIGQGMSQPANNYQQRKGSGRFTNVQKYLDANKGAGQQIAGQISKQGETQADKIRQGIQTAKSNFGQQEQQLQGQVNQGYQAGQQLFVNPLQTQEEQINQFKQIYDPTGLESQASNLSTDISGVQQGVQNLQNLQQQAQTESGRFDLLRNAIGGPKYSQGQRRLDQLFLQATPSARNISQQFGQLAGQYGQQASELGSDITARKSALQNLIGQKSQELQGLYSGGTSEGLEDSISGRGLDDIAASTQQRFEQAQQDVSTIDPLRERLAKNQLTSDDINNLGLSAGTRLYDVNLNDYISQANKVPTLAGVADPEEFARYRALQQLTGRTDDVFSGASEAGGFKPYDFNSEGLNQAIKKREGQYNDLVSGVKQTFQQPWMQSGQDQVNWYLNRWGNTTPIGQVFQSIQDIRNSENPSYQQLQNVVEKYKAYPNLTGSSAAPFVQAIQNLQKQLPDYQYNRVLGPADALESGGQFNVGE